MTKEEVIFMERIISEQDRIRRAEELLNKRRGTISARSINSRNEEKKLSFVAKIGIQIIVSICLFGILYFMAKNNIPFIENVREILNKDVDFELIYADGKKLWNQFNLWLKEDDENVNESNQNNQNENKLNETNELAENKKNETNDASENKLINEVSTKENMEPGIGGANENVNLSQDEKDIVYIKEKADMLRPLEGVITSKYGKREATDIISGNHAGIDIGAAYGADIVSAMDGTAEVVSSFGDYGNHVKIVNGEISTLYGHCSKIVVNQGESITKGQKIAEVGSTGKSTGPHLHFEVTVSRKTCKSREHFIGRKVYAIQD